MLDKNLIEDFNYFYFNSTIDKSFLPKRSIGKNLIFFYIKLARNFFSDLRNGRFFISFKDSVVFYSTSLNEYYSLRGVYDQISLPKIFVNNPPYNKPGIYFPRFLPSLISLFYLPAFLAYYFKSDDVTKDNINYSRNDVIHTFGYYTFFKYIFKNSKPKAVVISNDHLCDIRIIIHFCSLYKVPSFYIQHASVTSSFPKLIMDYALLEGEVSKDIYLKVGSDPSKIFLIGMVKADPWIVKQNERAKANAIGYAINSNENEALLTEDINALLVAFPDKKIILRPHPTYFTYQMKDRLKAVLENIKKTSSFSISDPRTENVFDFISQLDVLIAGDSSIHLESVLLNVVSIYYDNKRNFLDYYEYLKNDLVKKAASVNEITLIINSLQGKQVLNRAGAKRYIDTINTTNEGKSAILAKGIIEEKIAMSGS